MNMFRDDPELSSADERLTELGRGVWIDPAQKARLRDELLRRHQEMLFERSLRAESTVWSRFKGLTRLTLVAPAALASAVAVLVTAWALQISGHQDTQAAEAARISQALARTVPTVTAWRVEVHQSQAGSVSSYPCGVGLGSKRLYMRQGHLYLFAGKWFELTPNAVGSGCSAAWQWAFRGMALGAGSAHFQPGPVLGGMRTEVVTFSPRTSGGDIYEARAWFDRATGLVRRLETRVSRGGATIEVSRADYTYGLRGVWH